MTTTSNAKRGGAAKWIFGVILQLAILAYLLFLIFGNRGGAGEATALGAAEVFTLQTNCYEAGLFYDESGACYSVEPAGLDADARAAARVEVPGGASEGPVAPGAEQPAGQTDPAATPGAEDSTDTADAAAPSDAGSPAQPAVPSAPADPAAPTDTAPVADTVAPSDPASPTGPAAPRSPAAPADPAAPAPTTGTGAAPPAPGTSAGQAPPAGQTPTPAVTTSTIAPRPSVVWTVGFDFDPDPRTLTMGATGGIVDVGASLNNCPGFAASDPDLILTYTDRSGSVAGSSGRPIRFFFESTAGVDMALIVNDPFGQWWCNDNWQAGATSPMITIPTGPFGIYDIWVATVQQGASPAGALTMTEKPLEPTG